jgi:CBS domain-containing protein
MDEIKPLIRTRIPFVNADDRVSRVAIVLSRTRSNSAVVREKRGFVGFVMRKQLLRPPVAPETKAERLVSHPPVLDESSRPEDVVSLMLQSGCEMLPVVENGRFEGVVLARDLASNIPALGSMKLEDVEHRLMYGIPIEATISDAASALRENDIESVPLVGIDNKLAGWISFTDIFRYLVAPEKGVRGTGEFVGEKEHPLRNPAMPLSTRSGLGIEPGTDIKSALSAMRERKCNEITVIDGNRVRVHINVLGILYLTRQPTGILVQVAGLEDEDPIVAGQLVNGLRSTAAKIQKICGGMGTPELKVKSYKHRGSGRKRYEVRVSFSTPEQYVAEAKGWNLLMAGTQAIKKVEREIIKARSKLIDSHRHRRSRRSEGGE